MRGNILKKYLLILSIFIKPIRSSSNESLSDDCTSYNILPFLPLEIQEKIYERLRETGQPLPTNFFRLDKISEIEKKSLSSININHNQNLSEGLPLSSQILVRSVQNYISLQIQRKKDTNP